MHITLNFGALNYCGLAHIESTDFWGRADSYIAIFPKWFSEIILKQLENQSEVCAYVWMSRRECKQHICKQKYL